MDHVFKAIVLRQDLTGVVLKDSGQGNPTSGTTLASADWTRSALVWIEAMELVGEERAKVQTERDVLSVILSMPLTLIAPVTNGMAEVTQEGGSWGIGAIGADNQDRDVGAGVKVAILDTGIDKDYAAFDGLNPIIKNFTGETDEDSNGHGTHCAGTIFGQDVDDQRIGVARGIHEPLIGKVLGQGGGDSESIFRAINGAREEGAKVISMSLGIDFAGFRERLVMANYHPLEATAVALQGYWNNMRKSGSRMLYSAIVALAFVTLADAADAQLVVLGETDEAYEEWVQDQELNFIELPVGAGDIELRVENGQEVDRRHFPTILKTSAGSGCTVSLIGPSSVILAAHCLSGRRNIQMGIGGMNVRAGCTIPSTFNNTTLQDDIALCILERIVRSNFYETLDIVNPPRERSDYLLTGYGCTEPGEPSDGKLRVAFAPIITNPTGINRVPGMAYTASRVGSGDGVLCPGDSGGPLFRSGSDFSSARQIIGVNSGSRSSLGLSGFTALTSINSSSFVTKWVTQYSRQVCGINRTAGDCK